MKTIPLSRGMFAMCDDEDYEFLMEFSWHARKAPRTWYAVTNVGGKETGRTVMPMHQLLAMGAKNIDHWDRNGINNTKENLRIATLAQNHGNQAKTLSPRTSRFKGVSWRKDCCKWRACIGGPKTRTRIGHFTNEIEAAVAYDQAACQRYGEFARLNFP